MRRFRPREQGRWSTPADRWCQFATRSRSPHCLHVRRLLPTPRQICSLDMQDSLQHRPCHPRSFTPDNMATHPQLSKACPSKLRATYLFSGRPISSQTGASHKASLSTGGFQAGPPCTLRVPLLHFPQLSFNSLVCGLAYAVCSASPPQLHQSCTETNDAVHLWSA